MLGFLGKIEETRPFSEREAWFLFKMAALGEAIGWALLVSGILVRHYHLPGHNIAVPITGQIHGTFFVIYFAILIATYSSLRWSRLKFLVAAGAGVMPFGTFIFEQWASHTRQNKFRRALFCSAVLATVCYAE
jgi:integral membrane protein